MYVRACVAYFDHSADCVGVRVNCLFSVVLHHTYFQLTFRSLKALSMLDVDFKAILKMNGFKLTHFWSLDVSYFNVAAAAAAADAGSLMLLLMLILRYCCCC